LKKINFSVEEKDGKFLFSRTEEITEHQYKNILDMAFIGYETQQPKVKEIKQKETEIKEKIQKQKKRNRNEVKTLNNGDILVNGSRIKPTEQQQILNIIRKVEYGFIPTTENIQKDAKQLGWLNYRINLALKGLSEVGKLNRKHNNMGMYVYSIPDKQQKLY
jgi:hypothetical protein